jgi:predicted GIY-YIG superfamily endonuclease
MRTQQELGLLIESGLNNSIFIESASRYIDVVHLFVCGCALGAAYVGIIGDATTAVELYKEKHQSGKELEFFSQTLDISLYAVSTIDKMHRIGMTAEEIANQLKRAKLLIEI